MNTIHETEAVVVGAGAVGCSIAYWLRKRGKDVTLLDRQGPGAGTSTANFGQIWVQAKEPRNYMELSLRSSQLWPTMVDELGEDVDLRIGQGGLQPCLTEEQYLAQEALLGRQRQSPLFNGRMLSPREARDLQPGLSPNVLGALWSAHDADCNSIKWTYALARGCRRLGVKLLTETEVTGFDLDENNHIAGVLTSRGRIGTSYAVNAAGNGAVQVARLVGVSIDLFPQRGQILVSQAAPMVCPLPMSTVRQVPGGQFHFGVTMENVGLDLSTTVDVLHKIVTDGAAIVPAVRNLAIIRHFAGLRPMPRDGLPFLGPVPQVPGYYVAVGHSGITLSPIHGKIISDLIIDGHTSISIDDYDPLRFDARGTSRAGAQKWTH